MVLIRFDIRKNTFIFYLNKIKKVNKTITINYNYDSSFLTSPNVTNT